ncbi:hypothetical protein [Actinomyces howellii]|uniref:Integral membrane protein n=1 Tax=Actinomyces howellii TaxID=52771 RepID=A0A448HJU2_9ACTO|nr:hypothetical protein [Actinomyces howellii]VEG30004.1 Uncharacterised protein [Actinomyces howellii]
MNVFVPMIDPQPVEPPGVGSDVTTILSYVMWIGGITCFVSIVTIGVIFFLNATGRIGSGAEENVTRIGYVALASGLIGGASGITYALTGV